jgi:hypothetical protein
MNNCHVIQPKNHRDEEAASTMEFKGNKPAVPPLTTESVASVIYLVDEEEEK